MNTVWNGAGRRIEICDVGMRDGLQMVAEFFPTDQKIAWIRAEAAAGVREIEVSSFVPPKLIPQFADAEAVVEAALQIGGLTVMGLVPNLRGAERALSCRVDEVNLVMSASETHNRANLRMSREQSFAQLRDIINTLRGSGVAINVSLSTVFGCPMEGDVSGDEGMRLVDGFAQLDVRSMTLCDTTGMAYPTQVNEIAAQARQRFASIDFTLHFHNTRGMALANTMAALDAGIRRFDASAGGIGGCPYAPGASGNVCTEELVHMLNLMGYDTGVDLQRLLAVSAALPALIGHDVPSQLLKAGPRWRTHPAPAA